jgi:tetratricopeptide (TPR) repeat protein
MLIRFYLFFLLAALPLLSAAQLNTDSLKSSLAESSPDSNRVKTLNRLAWNLRSLDPKMAMGYALQSIKLASEIHFDKGCGDGYNTIGVIHFRRGEYVEATKAHLQALNIRDKCGDKLGTASSYINLGNIYSEQGNAKAAMDNYTNAENILLVLKDDRRLSHVYLNIGGLMLDDKKFDEALRYSQKAKTAAIKSDDKTTEAEALNNIGNALQGQKKYPEALQAYQAAFKISQAIDDRIEMADNMMNIGNMYRFSKQYALALAWHKRAEQLASESSYLEGLQAVYEFYSKDYEATGDYKTALDYHIRFKNLSDSLFNDENSMKVHSLMDKWETDRNEKDLILREQALHDQQENDHQSEQRLWAIASGAMVILFFAGYAIYAAGRMKRARLTIEELQKKISATKENRI